MGSTRLLHWVKRGRLSSKLFVIVHQAAQPACTLYSPPVPTSLLPIFTAFPSFYNLLFSLPLSLLSPCRVHLARNNSLLLSLTASCLSGILLSSAIPSFIPPCPYVFSSSVSNLSIPCLVGSSSVLIFFSGLTFVQLVTCI